MCGRACVIFYNIKQQHEGQNSGEKIVLLVTDSNKNIWKNKFYCQALSVITDNNAFNLYSKLDQLASTS